MRVEQLQTCTQSYKPSLQYLDIHLVSRNHKLIEKIINLTVRFSGVLVDIAMGLALYTYLNISDGDENSEKTIDSGSEPLSSKIVSLFWNEK